MPALFVLVRVGSIYFPLPWFLVWVLLIPLTLCAWLVGSCARAFTSRWQYRALEQAPRLLALITLLHGMVIDITDSRGKGFALVWV
jgi:hypothetical protein